MKICLFDPGFENNSNSLSSNLGDLIIQEAVNRELINIFGECEVRSVSTHTNMKKEQIRTIQNCSLTFVGGTNLLSSKMNEYRQWKISLLNSFQIKNAILLGVGWWQYQESPNLYTQILLKSALSNKIFHSVRDNYTKLKLESIGIKNILNTGCPTMWPLSDIKPEDIPSSKSENALLMLTDYSRNIDLDRKLIELLTKQYKTVFVWPQGRKDLEYIREFKFPLVILEHSMEALNSFLKSEIQFDYIGTRLHGGVKCLLSQKRTLVLEIDNRAKEIAIDTGLPTAQRDNFDYIEQWIKSASITKIKIDISTIHRWKSQFKFKNEKAC